MDPYNSFTLAGYAFFDSVETFKNRCTKNLCRNWTYDNIEFNEKDLALMSFPAFFILDEEKISQEYIKKKWRKLDLKYFLEYINGDIDIYKEAIARLEEIRDCVIENFGHGE